MPVSINTTPVTQALLGHDLAVGEVPLVAEKRPFAGRYFAGLEASMTGQLSAIKPPPGVCRQVN